jgi:lipid-binding SYLF domain-containing protein
MLLVFAFIFNVDAQSKKQKKKIKKAYKALEDTRVALLEKDSSMQALFNDSYGYVIFPNIGKAGFGVGGAVGYGIVFEQGAKVGAAKLGQLSIGFQAGGQSYREVVFFENTEAMQRFKENNVELSAQVSAVAAASGASADAKYVEGVVVITDSIGGLMYEASVGGQKFEYFKD